ncbi:restriction endonuclease subunit S [Ferruginivarius sediminum]|uniref:Restriction endonuclease n=1 Tax=Ferruginivarius sediminum TaxID=2661937 RepID=A0A369T8B5_9PROT|nr:restriction endonuclease subunit S [Ferruginivarius sediminum]RDD60595.1 restriction endonuclease [Ferruginivarius sediminum]
MSDRTGEALAQELPAGWARATIGELVQPRKEKVTPSQSPSLPFIGMEDVESHSMRLLATRSFGAMRSAASRFYPGDILYGRLRPYLNKVVSPNFEGVCSAEFIVLPTPAGLDPRFVGLRLNAPDFVHFASHKVGGDRPRIDFNEFQEFPINLPPLSEQRRIVEKIQALLSDIANGVESLDAVDRKLASYRQSLLHAAFTGEMTRGWRSASGEDDGAAAERSKLISTKPKCPVRPNLERVQLDIPKNWVWISPDEISNSSRNAITIGPFGSSLKVSDYRAEGVPLIFVRHIRTGLFSSQNPKYISPDKALELKSHTVRSGDILVTKMGDPPGDACLYPQDLGEAIITADCIKITPDLEIEDTDFFVHAIHSSVVKSQIRKITTGVAQQKVSLERFKSIALPFPPVTERREISRRLRAAFDGLEVIERDITGGRERANSLRRSILNSAFSGRLVAQDPDDEPASELLARIHAERDRGPRTSSRRGRPRKTEVATE